MNTVLKRAKTIQCGECFPDHHFNLRLGAQRIIEISSVLHSFSQDCSHQALASAFYGIISFKESPVKRAESERM